MKHNKGACLDSEDNCFFKDSESLAGFIGYMRVDIFIPHSQSLKERRQVLESLRKENKE